jgi:hypothetical protein
MLTSWLWQWTSRRRAVRASSNLTSHNSLRCEPMGFSRQRCLKIGKELARTPAALALILIPSLCSAAIYKCTAPDGSVAYTDEPCPADTTTRFIDPAAPQWLNDSSQTIDTPPVLPDAMILSQPEIIAILCANDEFKVWLKAQRPSLPEPDARTAKFIEISKLCRRALHLPDEAARILQMAPKRVLGEEMQASGYGSSPPPPPVPDRPT